MDDDLERGLECRCRSYRASWIGFSLYAFNLVATTLVEVVGVFLVFSGQNPHVGNLLGVDSFEFRFDTFRVWERLVACVALVAAFPNDLGWRRRAGLLLLLAIGDVVLWGITEAVPLGVSAVPTRHLVLCRYLRMAFGWSRFLLLAGLSADFARHVGTPRAAEAGRTARTTATAGAAIWFLYFVSRINWDAPWPLVERGLTREAFQLMMVGIMIQMICLIQASLLTLTAGRAAGRVFRETIRERNGFNPWSNTPSAGDVR